jgi:hypothetical protein
MALSLKLELKSNSHVLVTNIETKEQKQVTLCFIQKITNSSLMMLIQYQYYELIINADQHWNNLKRFDPELEKIIATQQQIKEQIIAKQQKWDEIITYNQDRRQCFNDDDILLLQSQQSYNRALIALQYADYCLTHDYRYNSKEGINQNATFQINLEHLLEEEQEIIILKKENQALRKKIAQLKTECIVCEIVE